MIVDLELEGWRAYDHVKVEFQPGTTFVVARNGVGKTSLLLGAAYALFGERSNFASPSSVRSGFTTASAKVSVALDDDRVLRIERTLTAKKSPPPVAALNGASVSPDEIDALLGDAFGADPATLARMMFLPAGSLVDYETEKLSLHQHLCRLFGVSQLQAVRDEDLKRLGTEARSVLRKVKDVKKSSAAEVGAWSSELEEIERELEAMSDEISIARARVVRASEVVELRARWIEVEQRRKEHARAVESIRGQLLTLLDDPVAASSDADLRSVLAELDRMVNERIGDLERSRGRLEGRIELLDASRHQLDDADADCPVCLRPLDGATREQAAAAHLVNLAEHRAEILAIESELSLLDGRRRGVTTLRNALANLGAVVEKPEEVSDQAVDAAEAEMAAADAVAVHLEERAAGLRGRAALLRSKLDDDEALRRQHAEAVAAYRREALVLASDTAVQSMIDSLIEERINPLAEQVTSRWKTVFKGSRPVLTLERSGELKLVRGDDTIAFADMSAGERAVALLITRLLVMSVTTPTGFLWLDEPLEQLDPANRRLIGQLLTASSSGTIRQLVVTTFEEEIARRLEQSAPDVHVKYVTTAM